VLVGAHAVVIGLSLVQRGEVVLELRPLLFQAVDLPRQFGVCLGGLAVSAFGLTAPVDQLVQDFVQPGDQGVAMIAAQNLADLGVQDRLQRGARARGDLGQGEGLALTDPDQAPGALRLGCAAATAGRAPEQGIERLFGGFAVQMAAVGQRELGARPPQKALFDAIRLAVDLELQGDARRRPVVAGRLKALDRLGLRTVALEQDRLQRREQRRLAHFVGADHQIQAIAHAGDPDRPVELAELLELESAQLHGALSLRCST
jgi:hypothetical protein